MAPSFAAGGSGGGGGRAMGGAFVRPSGLRLPKHKDLLLASGGSASLLLSMCQSSEGGGPSRHNSGRHLRGFSFALFERSPKLALPHYDVEDLHICGDSATFERSPKLALSHYDAFGDGAAALSANANGAAAGTTASAPLAVWSALGRRPTVADLSGVGLAESGKPPRPPPLRPGTGGSGASVGGGVAGSVASRSAPAGSGPSVVALAQCTMPRGRSPARPAQEVAILAAADSPARKRSSTGSAEVHMLGRGPCSAEAPVRSTPPTSARSWSSDAGGAAAAPSRGRPASPCFAGASRAVLAPGLLAAAASERAEGAPGKAAWRSSSRSSSQRKSVSFAQDCKAPTPASILSLCRFVADVDVQNSWTSMDSRDGGSGVAWPAEALPAQGICPRPRRPPTPPAQPALVRCC